MISSYNEDSDYSFGQKSAKIKHQSLFRCIFVRFLKIFVLYPALYLFLGTFHHTEKFIAPSLHIQNNSIIFVLCSRALDRTQAETVIQKADVHKYCLWDFPTAKIMDCQLFPMTLYERLRWWSVRLGLHRWPLLQASSADPTRCRYHAIPVKNHY